MNATPPLSTDLLDQNNEPETSAVRYNPLKDKVYITGLCLLALSICLFVFGSFTRGARIFSDVVFIHYALVWVFL